MASLEEEDPNYIPFGGGNVEDLNQAAGIEPPIEADTGIKPGNLYAETSPPKPDYSELDKARAAKIAAMQAAFAANQPAVNPLAVPMAGLNSAYNAMGNTASALALQQGQTNQQMANLYGQQGEDQRFQSIKNNIQNEDTLNTLQDIADKYHTHSEELSKSKIDPERYMNSRIPGQKTQMAFGMLLAGLGDAGLAFGGRPANNVARMSEIVQNNVNRDVQAQIHDYDIKRAGVESEGNFYKMGMDMYHNRLMAQHFATVESLGVMNNKIQQMAAQSNADNAPQLAKQAKAAIDAQRYSAMLNMQMAGVKAAQGKPLPAAETDKAGALKAAINQIDNLENWYNQNTTAGVSNLGGIVPFMKVPGSASKQWDMTLKGAAPSLGPLLSERSLGMKPTDWMIKNAPSAGSLKGDAKLFFDNLRNGAIEKFNEQREAESAEGYKPAGAKIKKPAPGFKEF